MTLAAAPASGISAQAPGSARAVLRQAAGLLGPRRRMLLVVVGLVATSALLELVPPLVLRRIVDDHLLVGRADGLLWLAGLYLSATAAVEGTRALAGYLTSVVAQWTLHDLRVRLFGHLQSLPISWFDRTPLGEAIARCTSDVEAIRTLFSAGVAHVVIDLARVVTISAALVTLSPRLAAVAVLTVPPLLVITRILQVQVRRAERAHREAVGRQGAQVQETLVGAETIRSFGREPRFVQRLRLTLTDTLAAQARSTLCSVLYTPNVTILAAAASALLLWLGARGTLVEWGVTLGTLTAFVVLLQRAFAPLAALGEEWQTVQGALAGIERVFEVLALRPDDAGPAVSRAGPEPPPSDGPAGRDPAVPSSGTGAAPAAGVPAAPVALAPPLTPARDGAAARGDGRGCGAAPAAAPGPEEPRRNGRGAGPSERPGGRPDEAGDARRAEPVPHDGGERRGGAPATTPAVRLDRMVFGYEPGRPVLHAVSLAVALGEHVALVGRTGAGKSSVLSLLGGLYAPWSGSVRVLGRDPRQLTPAERRQVFGLVPQAALLFEGTVAENVALFDPDVSLPMVERAVRLAGAERLVASLPHGYQTLLAGLGGGRGVRLSAGQTALLMLARALVWEPPLLLLDEATAAIDAASEAALGAALRAGVAGGERALLTVAHRLATAREADRVIVFEEGRIVEQGSPSALLQQGGRFAALVELEAAGWDWQSAPPAAAP